MNQFPCLPVLSVCLLLGFTSCQPEGLDTTWQERPSGTELDIFSLHFDQNGDGVAVAGKTWYSGSIVSTTNEGNQWNEVQMDQKAILDLSVSKEGTWRATGIDGHLWERDGAGGWTFRQLPEWRVNRAVIELPSGELIIGGGLGFQFGFLYRVLPDNSVHHLLETKNLVNDLAMCDSLRLIAAAYGAVFLSEDGGRSWEYLDITGDHFMAIDMVDDQIGYMVGYGGTILKTTDAWHNWSSIRNGDALSVSNTPFRALAFRDSDTGVLVGDAGTVWVTRDGGNEWNRLRGISASIDLTAVAIYQNDIFVAGTGGHIYQAALP